MPHRIAEQHPRIQLSRCAIDIEGDDRRVITRLFAYGGDQRLRGIFDKVNALDDPEVSHVLNQVLRDFEKRHHNVRRVFDEHYRTVAKMIGYVDELPEERRLLIGSYFTMEYSIQAAALFNPCMVLHPDQRDLADGSVRFIMSLRATGEGHVSSTVFRTGIIDQDGALQLDPPPTYCATTHRAPDPYFVKSLFRRKLSEMAVNQQVVDRVLGPLPDRFNLGQLHHAISEAKSEEFRAALFDESVESITWLAESNYQLNVDPGSGVADIVLFPQSGSDAKGIEDMRMVRFTGDDESVTYYGTYSAYDGFRVLPMLMETEDFREVKMHTLNGACARNKGMALFPRRIGGHYVMCSRIDGQNLFIMYSDYVYFWESAKKLASPKYPWEMSIIGNCGSPIETSEGWLLITHGVGPMRRYCLGALLLDLDDPTRIVGRLREPLLAPSEEEREGYTPNVVYSCGSMVHGEKLYLPYARSDVATRAVTIRMEELINVLLDSPPE